MIDRDKHCRCEVVSQESVAKNVHKLEIKAPDAFFDAFVPGQFAQIEIPDNPQLTLRRPMSVHSVDSEHKTVRFAFNVVGKGTKQLAMVEPGQELDVIMPLGNGFKVTDDMQNIWLVGGGMGSAPMASIVEKYPDRNYEVFLGFKNADDVFGLMHFENCSKVYLTTDDGSQGSRGVVTNPLAERLAKDKPDVILACGLDAFYKALAGVVGDVPTQISAEARMGCGTGGCETCVIKVNGHYLKACSDGPVFQLKEVDEFNG